MSKKSNLIKVGAIWIGETKNGDDMLSISMQVNGDEFTCIAFSNDYKKENKHPDFLIYADSDKTEEEAPPKKRFGNRQVNKKERAEEDTPRKTFGENKFKKRSPFV